MFIESLLMLVVGASGMFLSSSILLRVWRHEPLPFGVWWLPKDLEDRASIKGFIIGGIALFMALVSGSILVLGFLSAVKIALKF